MRLVPLAASVAAVLTLSAAPASAAERGPCIPSDPGAGTCQWWNAKVKLVADGDTIEADIAGVGRKQIRFTGINAMELTRYSHDARKRRGACHGLEATAFAERYIKASKWKVRLAAQDASSRSGRRLRRAVWVKSGGKWVDLAKLELAAGHALWLPNTDEVAHNTEYQRLAAAAMAAKKNLYDPAGCKAGPAQATPISVIVNWDADGGDEGNLNGEWIDVRNDGTAPLDLSGWFVRDSALRYAPGTKTPGYVFPAGTVVAPRKWVRLRVGSGADRAGELFWGLTETVFENVQDAKGAGDGAYLFDPDGDLRASTMYPCVLACETPLTGVIQLVADPKADTITLYNPSGGTLSLADHVLKLRNKGLLGQYVFGLLMPLGAVLNPGQAFTVPVANGLAPNGGVVELRSAADQLVTCYAWGFGQC